MELIRILQLSTADSKGYLRSSNNFHFNLNGCLSDLRGAIVPIFVKLRSFSLPVIFRKITISIYYGPRVSLINDIDVARITIKYSSFEELCMRLMHAANCQLKSTSCSYTFSDHSTHICEGVDDGHLLRVQYENCVFRITNGPGLITILTCNILRLMNFDDYILKSFSAHEIEESGEATILKTCSKPIMLDGRILIGKPKKYFDDLSTYCHVLADGLINTSYFEDGCGYPVIGSYCTESGKLDGSANMAGYLRVSQSMPEQLCISLMNEKFKPFDFNNGGDLVPITLIIDFYRSL